MLLAHCLLWAPVCSQAWVCCWGHVSQARNAGSQRPDKWVGTPDPLLPGRARPGRSHLCPPRGALTCFRNTRPTARGQRQQRSSSVRKWWRWKW